jgi:hypothetical protein
MQSVYEPFIIRGAALQRYINSVFVFSNKNPEIGTILNDGSRESEFMKKLKIPEHRGPTPDFQTNDMELIANTILKIVRMIVQFPEIQEKIALLCLAVTTGSIIDQSSNLRTLEMNILNSNLHNLSKTISGVSVLPSASIIYPGFSCYHKDSKYVLFSVSVV